MHRLLPAVLLLGAILIGGMPLGAAATASPDRPGVAPVALRIPTADVNASVVTAGIPGGVPDEPACLDVVLWYRETGRLGAPGNLVLFGVNAWGDDPAVFANLGAVQLDDPIDVIGEDGKAYRFLVERIDTYDTTTAPIQIIFGETPDEKRLTVFTGAGDYDPTLQTYDQVLVVTAQRTKQRAEVPATPIAVASPVADRNCIA